MKSIYEDYAEHICTTCKAEECGKGICVLQSNHLGVKCVDYIKDETKIKKLEKQLYTTAKQRKSLMGFTQNY